MLTFVGLGLYDEASITVAGRRAVADADEVFAEFYTSHLAGATVADLERFHGVDITVRDRDGVERNPEPILSAAESGHAVFLTGGDPLVSTTHVDLRLRAHERGIDTALRHAPSAATAAAGLTGLQNYRFGKATTLPFPDAHGTEGVPDSVVETIDENRDRGLHTLVYLDIKAADDRYMSGDVAAGLLAEPLGNPLGIVVARAGSDDPLVAADRLGALADGAFGDPLHLLVVPADLHHLERESLLAFADADPSVFEG